MDDVASAAAAAGGRGFVHFVAHTTEPDPDNFPPYTAWIQLHFSDVRVLQKPADQEVPYSN